MGNGMFIITTDHAGIPDIVEDGVNGVVMKKEEGNIYSRVHTAIQSDVVVNVCVKNRECCIQKYQEKNYLHVIESIFFAVGSQKNVNKKRIS